MISLSRDEIEALIDLSLATQAVEQAYRATSLGQVNLPPVGHLTFPQQGADCHIKYGYMAGQESFVIKVATGFPKNADHGVPTGNGLVLVMSAHTGKVEAVLHDEMLLTDIRTGLGGAIASRSLARPDAKRILIVGTGPQAIWQTKVHKALMPNLETFELWGRNSERADNVIKTLSQTCEIHRVDNLEKAVSHADIIVTATGSTKPIIESHWIKAGTHITAVGADAPGKQELGIELIARADLLVVDLISQCTDHGEVSHAVKANLVRQDDLKELGSVLESPSSGRTDPLQITVADLTGIAAQDIAIANAVLASWKNSNHQ